MMNRSNSDHEAYVPSMMSFAGLEGSSQKHHLWEWETSSHNPNTTIDFTSAANSLQNHPFFPSSTATPFLDCPAPPLLPINSFPFYAPPPPAMPDQYQMGLIKREDGIGSGRIGLNLGHRTYFSSGDALTLDRLFARSRGVYSLTHQPPRCQAEGCKADLSGAKHYHRRHKVCEYHSKAAVVIAGGRQQRFCQQCSRFHVLPEFDEAKRSCRKRLADHNRRRRKPQLPATTTDSSTSKNTSTNSTDHKNKQAQKNTRVTNKSTTTICTSNSSTNRGSLEGQQSYQKEGFQLRNGPALSLGGIGQVEKASMSSAYQETFVAMGEDKFPQQQQHSFATPSASSSTFFHHHNLFSGEASGQSAAGEGVSGHVSTHQVHQSNLLHLGQAMFEVDFL